MARLRILHAIHDFLPRHRAGSEIYAFELCRALAARHDVWVLCAECDPARPHGSLTWRAYDGLPVVELVNNWAFGSFEETYRSPRLNESLAHVLHALRPDVLHAHNLLNLSMDLPALARALGIPIVATLHDYTLLCAAGGQRVHAAESHVCTEIDTTRCRRCFAQSPLHAQMALARLASRRALPLIGRVATTMRRHLPWLLGRLESALSGTAGGGPEAGEFDRRIEQARRVFESVELFVSPSAALAREFERYGLPAERLLVSDNGMRSLERAPRGPRGDRLRVGFVGTLVWHKGAHVLIDAVKHLPPDRIEALIFGDRAVFPAYARSLRARASDGPVRFMGAFAPERAPQVYAAIDVLIVPSLWLENSPLVVHEAFQAGVPVVAARIGGLPDLVTDGVNGLLYDAFDAGALASALRRLLDEPGLLDRLSRSAPSVKTIEDDARAWEERYETVLGRASAGVAGGGAE
jgi:glycosyltransferase involved in cell wall biosynthesis